MSDASAVLDASALLAYLRGEPGKDRVAEAVGRGVAISAVNWAEVLSKLVETGLTTESIVNDMLDKGILAGIQIHAFEETTAQEVARLRRITKSAGLSLGDRACLALASSLALPALTAEGTWKGLKLGVKVVLIR